MINELSMPEVGTLTTTPKMELDEARKILILATVVSLELQPEIAIKVDEHVRQKLLNRIMAASYEELTRRIEAISNQNPGILVEAMKRGGYKVQFDGEGNVGIDVSQDSGGYAGSPGRVITMDEFERIKI